MSANTVRKYVLELDTERQKAQARLSRLCAARCAERVTSAIFKTVR